MCLATVYVEQNGQQERVLEDVAWIKCDGGGTRLVTFLGESKQFSHKIKSVDLVNGSIILEADE